MKDEEKIREIVSEEICNKNFSKRCDLLITIFIIIVVLLVTFNICDVIRYNATHKSYDKELEFCKSIYESDKVVLEQCKDYFVILGDKENE